jgi:general secretion pathway protein D
MSRETPMRIPVFLTAAILLLGAGAHAAEPTSVASAEVPPAIFFDGVRYSIANPPSAAETTPATASPAADNAVPAPAAVPPAPAEATPPPPPTPAELPPPPPPVPAQMPPPPTPSPARADGAGPAAKGVVPDVEKAAHAPVYISMDFTDVEIPVLVKFMSEQTKKNFIFDERVQGKITIISPRKITTEEAYEVFLSVLQVKGFTVVEQGNTLKIIAARDAKQETIPTVFGREAPAPAEFITRLVPLRYVDTQEVVTLLTPIVSKDGMLSAFASSNTLLVIDSRANIDRILRILSELDVEGVPPSMMIFTLRYASAQEMAKTFDTIYQETVTPGAAPGARPRTTRVARTRGVPLRFIPDARTNSLIVLAHPETMRDIGDLVQKLDVPGPATSGGKINVYYLENADAEDLAKVLASLTERKGEAVRPGQPALPQAAQQPTVKSIISAELEGGVRITPDKATNSLIIVASLNDYETIVQVIKRLDIRRRQVFVEAVFMEVNLDNTKELGVEWRGAVEVGNSGAILGGTNFGFQGGVTDLIAAIATGNPLVLAGQGLIAGGFGGTVTLPDGTQIPAVTAILRAAQTLGNINILSSPHLITVDNKEAEIIVAENVPFITSQSRDQTNLANVINTVERKDVGIILRLTPHIHESEFVTLDIYQEASALKEASLVLATTIGPTTTKRSTKTSVLVKNGDAVLLGGLMQEQINNTQTKVPLLGDIPLLGRLFRFDSVVRKKTNLLIMLTPHIIKEPSDMVGRTLEKTDRLKKEFDQKRKESDTLLPDAGKGGK